MTEPVQPVNDVDALARQLPRAEPAAERSAAMRHAILDAAQASPDLPLRRSARRWVSGAITAVAAAACIWLVARSPRRIALRPPALARGGSAQIASPTAGSDVAPHPSPPTALSIDPSIGSALAHDDAHDDARASAAEPLHEGATAFAPTRPLQLARGDATITAPPGARFEVEVRGDEVKHVTVTAGWVVIASTRAATVMLPAHHTWTPEASVDAPAPAAAPKQPLDPASPRTPAWPPDLPAPSPPAPSASPLPTAPPPFEPMLPATGSAPPAPSSAPPRFEPTPPTGSAAPPPSSPRITVAPSQDATRPDAPAPAPAVPRPTPGEQDFRDGLRALLAGDAQAALGPLVRACVAPSSSQADICYWAAVARLRTGDRDRARRAFADLLARWPDATHAGEASVALGWLLLDAGDPAGARARFAAAANDRIPSVRAGALRGLAAAK